MDRILKKRLRLSLTLKFFFIFWVGASLITLATFVGTRAWVDRHNDNEQYIHRATRTAERIVDYYERAEQAPRKAQRLKSTRERRALKALRDSQGIVSIEREDGEQLITPLQPTKRPSSEIQISGQSGTTYLVTVKHPPITATINRVTRAISFSQLIFILIASAAASAFMGWYIARPIRNLSQFARSRPSHSNLALPNSVAKRNDELGDLGHDINAMASTLEQIADSQRTLLHDVSHELRAPLARLQAMVGLVEQQSTDSKATDRMHHELARTDQLITDILALSRSDLSSTSLANHDVYELIQEAIDNLRTESPDRQVSLFGNSLSATTDYELLYRAVENLLRNADKYSPNDRPISVNLFENNDNIIIQIDDNGPGVSESDLQKLEQPFYRAGNQMHTDGFGLGLSIVTRSLGQIGGELKLENRKQGGLRATITLKH